MGRQEGIVETYLVRQCRARGFECRKVIWYARRGAPDRLIMFPIWPLVWVECKSHMGKLDEHQKREILLMRQMGQTVYVVYTRQMVDDMFRDIEERYIDA